MTDFEAKARELHNTFVRGDAHTVGLIRGIETALREAVAAEREACALTAEKLKTISISLKDGKGHSEPVPATGIEIAESIRSRGDVK